MRYNLKNFPSNDIYYIDTWAHAVKKWKIGFEKELQDWYEICKEGCEYCDLGDEKGGCLLKQILGDSE